MLAAADCTSLFVVPPINHKAKILDPHRVSIAADGKDGKEQTFTAERILVATGSRSLTPTDVPGIEHSVTSDAFFEWANLPKDVVIVGGGYIATEFAGILHASGQVAVHQIIRSELLSNFDIDLRTDLLGEMKKKGIDMKTHTRVTKIEKTGADAFVVHLKDAQTGATSTLNTNAVLYATGRIPNTANLGLEAAGVKLNARGAVGVNEYSQTNLPSIYAVGDVTDRMMLVCSRVSLGSFFSCSAWTLTSRSGTVVSASHCLDAGCDRRRSYVGSKSVQRQKH